MVIEEVIEVVIEVVIEAVIEVVIEAVIEVAVVVGEHGRGEAEEKIERAGEGKTVVKGVREELSEGLKPLGMNLQYVGPGLS